MRNPRALEPAIQSSEAAQLAETVASDGFGLILQRMHAYRQKCLADLTVATSWERTRHLQGEIAGVECCINIPVILHNEYKKRGQAK